jgi:probable rRNA maturation factor
MINIFVLEKFENKIENETLKETALAVLKYHDMEPEKFEISIAIEDNDKLQELNSQFLSIEAPTDVLSFPSGEEEDPDSHLTYLGDIIISYPKAEMQAQTAGHSALAEIQLLITHGVLHLLGYDHAEQDEKDEMWTAQKEILDSIGCKLQRYPD